MMILTVVDDTGSKTVVFQGQVPVLFSTVLSVCCVVFSIFWLCSLTTFSILSMYKYLT